jgi:hypothetical protein
MIDDSAFSLVVKFSYFVILTSVFPFKLQSGLLKLVVRLPKKQDPQNRSAILCGTKLTISPKLISSSP